MFEKIGGGRGWRSGFLVKAFNHLSKQVKTPVGYGQIAGLELVKQFPQQPEFMLVLVALGVVQQRARGQAEHPHQPDQQKAATGPLAAGLRIGSLIFLSVGRADRGGVDELGP